MCPSYLATRDEKDSTRGRARVLQELANGTLVKGCRATRPCTKRSTCACRARAARPTARPASTWRPTRPRCCTSATGAGCVRRRTTRSAGCRGWARLAVARAAAGERGAAPAGLCARTAKRLGGIDERRAAAHVRRAARSATGSRATCDRRRRRCCCGWTRSPTTSRPEVGQGRGARAARPPGTPSASPTSRCAAGSPGSRPASSTVPASSCAATLDALAPAHSTRACRSSVWNRRAPRCCAATWPSCCPTTRARHAVAQATRTLAELLAATPGWTAPDLAGVDAVAQPHCHQHAVMGWAPDAQAARARPAPTVTAVGGCCGLAGNFGVERGHYEVSVAVAETALLPAVRARRTTPSCSPTDSPAAPSSSSSRSVHSRPPGATARRTRQDTKE